MYCSGIILCTTTHFTLFEALEFLFDSKKLSIVVHAQAIVQKSALDISKIFESIRDPISRRNSDYERRLDHNHWYVRRTRIRKPEVK